MSERIILLSGKLFLDTTTSYLVCGPYVSKNFTVIAIVMDEVDAVILGTGGNTARGRKRREGRERGTERREGGTEREGGREGGKGEREGGREGETKRSHSNTIITV